MISIKSPLRVDLAGGTLDCWPLYLFVRKAWTINIGINLFSYVELKPRNDAKISIKSKNFDSYDKFTNLNELINSPTSYLKLVQEHLKYWMPSQGFDLVLSTDSPVGGGLAGSSSLSVSLIKAFSTWADKKLSEKDIVRLACNIETRVLGKPAGTQDYIPALSGGLNSINYHELGIDWTKLSGFSDEFNRCALLVYTGKPHHSGLNNWDVIRSAMESEQIVIESLKNIADIAIKIKDAIHLSKFNVLSELFKQETNERLKLSSSFSSPEISLVDKLLSQYSASLKICGAGGGGCVLIWCEKDNEKKEIEKIIIDQGLKIIKVKAWTES